MKKQVIFIAITLITIFIGINLISASEYRVQFNQVGNKIIVNQSMNEVSSPQYSEGLERVVGGFYFVKKVVFSENFSYAEVKLRLDKGFVINTDEAYPTNFETSSDGQNILLIWRFYNVSNSSPVAFFVKIENTSVFYRISIFIIITILILVAIGSWIWFYFKKRNKNKFEEHLMPSEKKVITELKKANKNEMWQKQLLLNTGFSKAKLSRVVRDLEARGLVSKTVFGNTNKISLK
jgi:uncharacterized membrane protein